MADYMFLGLNNHDVEADEVDSATTMERTTAGVLREAALASRVALAVIGLVEGEQKLVAVRVNNLNHIVTPDPFPNGDRPFRDLSSQLVDAIPSELDEEAARASARRLFAENDLAFAAIDLADGPGAVPGMPLLAESQHVEVEGERDLEICDNENGSRIPLLGERYRCCCMIHSHLDDPPNVRGKLRALGNGRADGASEDRPSASMLVRRLDSPAAPP